MWIHHSEGLIQRDNNDIAVNNGLGDNNSQQSQNDSLVLFSYRSFGNYTDNK